MSTETTTREILHTTTEHRKLHLTLDEIHAKAEAYFGLKLHRREESCDGYELTGYSPTNVCILKVCIYESQDGWRFGGYGDVRRESWHELCRMHEETTRVDYVRESGQMLRVEHHADGTVTENKV